MDDRIVVYNSELDRFWDQLKWEFIQEHPFIVLGLCAAPLVFLGAVFLIKFFTKKDSICGMDL